MLKYTAENVRQAIGPIDKIKERPNFGSLWQLRVQLIAGTKRIKNDTHPTYGHSGYIMSWPEYALLSAKEWIDAPDVGSFFDIPANAFNDTEQQIREKKWQVEKDNHHTLENVELIPITIIECAIDKSYHTGATVMGATGLEQLTAPQIISHMQLNYGVPGIGEIKKALLCLNKPMDHNMPIGVMLGSLEEVQIFLLAIPDENIELTEFNLIDDELIKLFKTGDFYTKALEKWNWRLFTKQHKWATFCTVMVGEYKRMLAERSGTKMWQEGYGTALNAVKNLSDEESQTETIVKYAERASLDKSKVRKLEGRLSMLEMGSTAAQAPPGYAPQPQMQAAYFTPAAPTLKEQMPPQTMAFQPPPQEAQ